MRRSADVRGGGAAVAVAARTEAVFDARLPGTIHETVAAIEAEGGRAVAIRADLGRDDDVERLVADARAALGPIDLLVSNAALTVPGRPPSADTPTPAPAPAPTPAPTPHRHRHGRRRRAGSFLDFPLKGYRLHFQIGLSRATASCSWCCRTCSSSAGRHRQHQLARRVRTRRGPLRARGRHPPASRTAATRPPCTTSPRRWRSRWRPTTSR